MLTYTPTQRQALKTHTSEHADGACNQTHKHTCLHSHMHTATATHTHTHSKKQTATATHTQTHSHRHTATLIHTQTCINSSNSREDATAGRPDNSSVLQVVQSAQQQLCPHRPAKQSVYFHAIRLVSMRNAQNKMHNWISIIDQNITHTNTHTILSILCVFVL